MLSGAVWAMVYMLFCLSLVFDCFHTIHCEFIFLNFIYIFECSEIYNIDIFCKIDKCEWCVWADFFHARDVSEHDLCCQHRSYPA